MYKGCEKNNYALYTQEHLHEHEDIVKIDIFKHSRSQKECESVYTTSMENKDFSRGILGNRKRCALFQHMEKTHAAVTDKSYTALGSVIKGVCFCKESIDGLLKLEKTRESAS